MRILITGAGLIGCYTARELAERGDDVTFFDLRPDPTGGGNVGMDMYAMLQAALPGKPAPMGPGIVRR